MASKAPKQWALTERETITSFESWKNNMLYILSLDEKFTPYLSETCTWQARTKANPYRGFNDTRDGDTRQQKTATLELMLGQIANFAPVISRNTIVKSSTSLPKIWQTIRLYYGFQSTGARFLDFCDIKLEDGERHEALYQRLVAFIDDSLLNNGGGIKHHGNDPDDEEMTPTLENLIVLIWLKLIHPELPAEVKQRYGTELRSTTLASIKPEISQALDSMLSKIRSCDDTRVMRSRSYHAQKKTTTKECPICKAAGRLNIAHFLSQCKFLPENDRHFLKKTKTRQIVVEIPETDLDSESEVEEDDIDVRRVVSSSPQTVVARRVKSKKSPQLKTFYKQHSILLTLDTGAESNMIKASLARLIGAKITPTDQVALQADGSTRMKVIGETRLNLSRNGITLVLEALVIEDLDEDVLAGTPFMERNDVWTRPSQSVIMIQDKETVKYDPEKRPSSRHAVRRISAHVIRAPDTLTTVWPGEFLEVEVPAHLEEDDSVAVEPRLGTKHTTGWPLPDIYDVVAGKVRLVNTSGEPQLLHKHEHFCQVMPTDTPMSRPASIDPQEKKPCSPKSPTLHSTSISLDPDSILPCELKKKFEKVHLENDLVFDPNIPGYNNAAGRFEAIVNMGPTQPPQRKGRVPQYSRNRLEELQTTFDRLEDLGVFRRPEEVGVVVEYLNPSFLVQKPNGGFRLVTAFADVGRYCKPSPSLMPDVDSTLRSIACWKFIAVTDLTSAFYQIPLSTESMKYCGVATPFKGVRVYTRSAMGMPGSETALEELMCRVLGDLIQEGVVAKLADDLYCGGNTPEELLSNWSRVLLALRKCDLRLSAHKTVVCPQTTTILGWIWNQGTIKASPHRLTSLTLATVPPTVKGLRSFIGAYKVLGRVIPDCASFMAPLDDAVAGLSSNDSINWSDELRAAFTRAQHHISNHKAITLPQPSDQLWIVTDGSVKQRGIGATLYVTRKGKTKLAGFFSAKLRQHQVLWLPCEIEALAIAGAIQHFSPYIVQAKSHSCVLTDSKPCVQAFQKLCRGEFSASPRVTSFLSTASRYQVSIRHLAGSANLPSDFASRNAPQCTDTNCQICCFISKTEDAVVRQVSTTDIISGNAQLPYKSRPAWLSLQAECADLRRVHSHLRQGTRPSKKSTTIRDVKRYLNVATISSDGLLVVRKTEPLMHSGETIIVPRQALPGLLTALHIRLDHPSKHQLKLAVQRHFYALDLDNAIMDVTNSCHTCISLKQVPAYLLEQSSEEPPPSVGSNFAADVMRRYRQVIFVLRETTTSYTVTRLLEDEKRETLRDALVSSCIELRPLDGPSAIIRVDSAPGFVSLNNDQILQKHRICLEFGRVKNPNKNPVAEKAIQELEEELMKSPNNSHSVSMLTLSVATARLNSRIRARGLSAREMFMQRDQFTNDQIPIADRTLIEEQQSARKSNHPYSQLSKNHKGIHAPNPSVKPGDLVYLICDKSKHAPRTRYLVSAVDGEWCSIKKFSGSQLRAASYKVKRSECIVVPTHSFTYSSTVPKEDQEDTEEPFSIPIQVEIPAEKPPSPPPPPSVIIDSPNPPQERPSPPLTPPTADQSSITVTSEVISTPPRRSSRTKQSPKWMKDQNWDLS